MDRVPEIRGEMMSPSLLSHYRLTARHVNSGLQEPDLPILQNQGEASLTAALGPHGAAPREGRYYKCELTIIQAEFWYDRVAEEFSRYPFAK